MTLRRLAPRRPGRWWLRLCAAPLAACLLAVPEARGASPPAAAKPGGPLYTDAPPPPRAMPAGGTVELYLELVVNGTASGRVVPVTRRDGHFYVDAQDLRDAGVRVGQALRGPVAADALPSIHCDYDEGRQQLHVDMPLDWLPPQYLGRRQLYDPTPATSSLGFLLNYDLYASDAAGGGSASLWSEQRMFDGFGEISNTGVWRASYGGAPAQGRRYVRYDTTWTFSDQDRLRTYMVGDLVTGALSWTSAVRLGGISVARDFSVRPDLITYPLPAFSGQAAVPTALDLFINGAQASHEQIRPGPFTISAAPFINGAGQATVVTTDALGRQVSTTVPFYVASTLLQKGLTDYALALGALRQDYGLRSFGYGEAAVSGSLRHGLSDGLTLEGHAEGARHLALAGLGAGIAAGRWGTLNLAGSASRGPGADGRQWSLGYSYYAPVFGWAMQHLQRSAGYTDLARYAQGFGQQIRRSDQISFSLSLGPVGNIGLGYFDVRTGGGRELGRPGPVGGDLIVGDLVSAPAAEPIASYVPGSRTRLASLSWTRSLWSRLSLYAYVNRDLDGGGYSAQLQLLLRLDGASSVTAVAQRDSEGGTSEQLRYSRSVPSQGGFGWNLAYAGGGLHYQQADLTWRGRDVQLQGGAYGEGGRYTRWGEASGALVWMDGGLYASNRIDDAFVLVSTDKYGGVPVRYENQVVGSTDGSGHLLVPWVTSYYRAKFEIDPLNLPANVETPKVEDYLSVRRGSGALLRFPVKTIVAASIVLVDARGQPLPRGALATHQESGQQSPVGWDGLVYFTGLQADNHLSVALPAGGRCRAAFAMDTRQARVAKLGPLPCR